MEFVFLAVEGESDPPDGEDCVLMPRSAAGQAALIAGQPISPGTVRFFLLGVMLMCVRSQCK